MSSPDPQIARLEDRMARAVDAQDFETAARLRDELKRLRDRDGEHFRRQVPGKMGLGTDQQVLAPPEGWVPPPKPDLMTTNVKPRGGGRKR